MKKLDHFVLKRIQETSKKYIFLTQQLQLVLPTELLNKFNVCSISDTKIKISVNSSTDLTLIRFYLKNIRQKCMQVYNNNKLRIDFIITPDKSAPKEKVKPNRKISDDSKKIIESYANNEMDQELKRILLKLANT